ncbi:hypothetical protein SAMN04488591_2564 [Microbacterium azadirachtae]|uniref:Uncharacterized protein n=1 Tax=Microbacterium azadirachtae TaxID=582680 RepID=A0A1I6I871_9MICO|nr:hypothetical protein SAMN04488591_2564 [Microbacterium azadirachtae]
MWKFAFLELTLNLRNERAKTIGPVTEIRGLHSL